MYRLGILPSGKPMRVALEGDALPGMTFACASCHLRSGVGAMEDGTGILPINGERLFRPLYRNFPSLTEAEREKLLPGRYHVPPVRPAYTEGTLGMAIRKGIDPSGRSLRAAMPRYVLSDQETEILVTYLKTLSARPSPGVTDQTLFFATVVTEEVSQEEREAMLGLLEQRFQMHNRSKPQTGFRMARMLNMQEMGLGFREWSLARWLLKGPPDTWPRQLDEYYRTQPVFALVGGISTVGWEPVHTFCEARGIPCLFPLTELPPLSSSDYYTLYFSKGCRQEAETAARYLATLTEPPRPRRLVQAVGPGLEAQALAEGFQKAWTGLGHGPVETVPLKPGSPVTGAFLAALAGGEGGTTLLLWAGPEVYGALRSLPASQKRPARVFLSSTLLQGRLWDLPEEARPFTYLTYPYRQPGERTVVGKMGGPPIKVNKEFRKNDRRIASRTLTILELLSDRLGQLERNFYRDHLLDLFDAMAEQDQTDYEQLNFGPGKRYVSEGCYIMQVAQGPEPSLLRKSEWIIH